ncbi:MAG: hypothetical protein ACE5ED_04920 [Rhodothalassiaceae bacterium]
MRLSLGVAVLLAGATPLVAQEVPSQGTGGPAPSSAEQPATQAPAPPRIETPLRPPPGVLPVSGGPAADRPPTSILVGPYLPEGSIALPALAPPSRGQTAQSDAEGSPPVPGEEEIAVDRLSSLDPSAIGVWSDPQVPALPVTMWDGTPRPVVTMLLPHLPLATASPAGRALARRLLLSPARVPAGGDDAPQPELLGLRLAALARGGAVDDLLALAEHVPAAAMTEEIQRLRADALLVRGDYAGACEIAGEAVGNSGAADWLRILAMCAALEGDRGGTDFRLSLLSDAGESKPAFTRLVERLLVEIEGGNPAPGAEESDLPPALDPLVFALARLTRTPISDKLALDAPPLLLGALVEMPDLAPDLRLRLARRALEAGLIDGLGLAPLLAGIPFDDLLLAVPLSAFVEAAPETASSGDGDVISGNPPEAVAAVQPQPPALPQGLSRIALLFQKAMLTEDAGERLATIGLALDEADRQGLRFAIAQALSVPLAAIRPDPALAGRADLAGRIALAAAQPERARAWYEAARTAAAAGDGEASAALARLWPLLLVAGGNDPVPYSDTLLDLWWQGRGGLGDAERLRRGDLLFAILDAFAYPVAESLRQQVLANRTSHGAGPGIALWRDLMLAIGDRRTGAVVLESLVGLGHGGAAAAEPAFLVTAIAGLNRVGLERDARRLALEALIGGGF